MVNETQARKLAEPRLRQSDEVFRLLVESVKDYAIFVLDPNGIVATWNDGAGWIKGYTADEIVGQHFSIFYPKEARESGWPERELGIAAKEGRFVDEGIRVRKDGSTFWAHVVITALRDQSGELRGFSKVTHDLTERKETEERSRQRNKELRDRLKLLLESERQVEARTLNLERLSGQLLRVQDEERRRLARTLRDDLGLKLVGLKIELDMQDESSHGKGSLGHARELSASALQKVRDMTYMLHPPMLDESGLIPALHWYFDGMQNRGLLRISFEYKPILFPRLSSDIETALFRVVQESLTNVHRHSESKDARIDITQERERVCLRIRDFGKGIADSKLGTVAQTGVGISGMKERVNRLNGELRISRTEPGTFVEVTIPLIDSLD